jgi:hypothetical protein
MENLIYKSGDLIKNYVYQSLGYSLGILAYVNVDVIGFRRRDLPDINNGRVVRLKLYRYGQAEPVLKSFLWLP